MGSQRRTVSRIRLRLLGHHPSSPREQANRCSFRAMRHPPLEVATKPPAAPVAPGRAP
ncbi:hypothetical protein T261_07045 [Streptomyces lydicus]|nr:hypothetical protein T261_07045 [Streptomyces lydicus]